MLFGVYQIWVHQNPVEHLDGVIAQDTKCKSRLELEITVIGIIDFGGVTSAIGCYLYSTRKFDNTGYSSLMSSAHKLKKYIWITMDCCNRRLFLPLEDDGLTGGGIILVYQTHSLIGYTMKEINRKSRPC